MSAPARGVRRGLTACLAEGYEAWAVFVVQMRGVSRFEPNRKTDPAFADALAEAAAAGVRVLALDCSVTPDSIAIADPVPVRL